MMLMEEAERIARDEHGSSKLAVISGIKNILSVNGMAHSFFWFFSCPRYKRMNTKF